jgi:glycine hydroxymethyltransferase
VIVADLDDTLAQRYWPAADRGVFPGASSNHHLHTLPALLVAVREMRQHAVAYATQIVHNAKALGQALDDEGIRVEAGDFGYTMSHQIAINVAAHGGGVAVAQRLEANDIIVNYNLLPDDTEPRNPSGLRLGVQEMTRYGMREGDVQRLAGLIADAIKGKHVTDAVHALRAAFGTVHYV